MNKFINFIITKKKIILSVFIVITIISIVLSINVSTNYNMVDYLPKNSQSTTAIKIMEEEFSGEMPNAKIMLTNVSIEETIEAKDKILQIDGVNSVKWIDDIIGIDTLTSTPIEYLDSSILKGYYENNNALLTLSIEGGKEKKAVNDLYEIIGDNNAATGEAINTAQMQKMSVTEVLNAVAILLPIIIIILLISTSSWVEPLFFLITIGVAVVINMGSNILFGEISFITLTVSPILQLAVSLDYAIFLLHSFNKNRLNNDPTKAMILAMKSSMPTITASALTTIVGFSALVFMRFGIGADLGLNLIKGVLLSFISVMILLPVITLICYNTIDKTKHRRLLPSFSKSGKWLMKVRIPFLIIAIIVVVPAFFAQSNTKFMYGIGGITNTSRVGKDTLYVEETFERENPLVLLLPKENTYTDMDMEATLCNEFSQLPHVTDVLSYVTTVGMDIAPEFVPKEIHDQFYSDNYARIIINTNTKEEGKEAFDTVQSVFDITNKHYDTYYLTGQSATLYDMKNIVSTDTKLTSLVAIIGIFLVILITFRSLSLPFILLFTIETAIWINLSIPYITGNSLNFIGYLIISTVQLGATVDYAILFTNSYVNNRKTLSKMDSMTLTIKDNLISILISAAILTSAGFVLALTTSNPIIGELGILLARGTLLSLTMVACVLPAILVLCDKLIKKTTLKNKFL